LEDFGSGDGDDSDDALSQRKKALLRRMRGPRRDPELYELNDYL